MPTTVTLGDGTITGINTITVGTSATLSGVATAPTVAIGTSNTNIATSAFVSKNATRPAIDFVSVAGHNAIFFLSEGKVYSASGGQSTDLPTGGSIHGNISAGRNTNSAFGLENIQQIAIPSDSPVIKITSPSYAGCAALLANGELWVWGQNSVGTLGLNNLTIQPIPVLSTTGVVDLYSHPTNSNYGVTNNRLFIKKTDGYIYGAGYNINGAIGDATIVNKQVWTQLTSLGTNVTSFWNMGSQYGCAVAQKSDGTIWVTGYNGFGQLGINSLVNATSWTNTGTAWNGGDYTMILKKVVGGYSYYDNVTVTANSCMGMLLDNGTNTLFRIAGSDGHGQMGNGATTGNVLIPITPTVGVGRIRDVACINGGVSSFFVLMADNTLYGWGYNGYGQLGIGNVTNQLSPVVVANGVDKIFCDGYGNQVNGWYAQMFIRSTNGLLYGAGYNANGAVGVGDVVTPKSTWVEVRFASSSRTNIKDVGGFHAWAANRTNVFITDENDIYVCGHNGYRQVGGIIGETCTIPVKVTLNRGY